MTNFEKIKGYSIEEMASYLFSIYAAYSDFPPCDCCGYDPCRGIDSEEDCIKGIIEWLESEAEEDV